MLSSTVLQTSFILMSAFIATTQVVQASPKPLDQIPPSRIHRRHHPRRAAGHRRSKETACSTAPKTTSTASVKSTEAYISRPSSSSSSSSLDTNTNSTQDSITPSTNLGLVNSNLATDGIHLGFLPDDGDAGGQRTTMAQVNQAIRAKSAAYGWYAQAHSGTLFDGSQLLAVLSDVKACDCVFQPAVMPIGGWKGLTSDDNSQAIAIAKVMKKFTDEGIPVWLRFAHEMNYYQTDGTYSGDAADFKAGWAAVASACKEFAPQVKMWWTPNVASDSNYAQYEPEDMSTVDLVGVDYYPKSLSTGSEFTTTMKSFHDKYAVEGRQFAIGETGLGYAGSQADRISWLKQVMSSKPQLPQMIAASWFNYQKEYDYRILTPSDGTLSSALKTLLKL